VSTDGTEPPSEAATTQEQVGRTPLDAVVDDVMRVVREPVGLIAGPWPLSADTPGIGDDAHRALLVEDWADPRTKPAKLAKLIDVQLVGRNRQHGADHPAGRDLGITLNGDLVGRALLDLQEGRPGAVLLVDIAIRPINQRSGIGREVLRALQHAAAGAGRPIRVTAVFGTPALRWFQRSGFVEIGGDALYHHLEWRG
jgi:N-acetylglutamate synthase-like GNAT family acetyltransferase